MPFPTIFWKIMPFSYKHTKSVSKTDKMLWNLWQKTFVLLMLGVSWNDICYHIYATNNLWLSYFSHLRLGWLYVFSSFPPHPLPQKPFPLTSKPLELHLWYLAQRIYGSGEMYWMTFLWPWPKVTAVASISKNLLVGAIKWEPLIRSLQNVAAFFPLSWWLGD